MMSTVVVSTRLTDEESAKLKQLAAGAGVSKAMVLRLLVQAVDTMSPPKIIRQPVLRQSHVTWQGDSHE